MNPPLRVVALGDFHSDTPPLAPRLAALQVEPCRVGALEQLPELGRRDILLTELAWLSSLPPQAAEALSRRAGAVAGWVALTDARSRFKDHVAWLRLGVGHFFALPLDPERLAALIEEIHDAGDGPPLRVILVDDDQASLAAHGAMLRHAGIEVLATDDPLLVLEALEEQRPDVLVADIEMPGCQGTELVAILRQRADFADLPAIYLTAYRDMGRQLLARATAAEDFLVKPVAPELLVASVRAHALRLRAQRRASALRRQGEARARARLEQLRMAIDQHAIVSVADRHGDIVHVNDKFCAISGYDRAELIGRNHRMVKSDTHPPEFYRQLWRTISGGEVWQGEICNRRKDGGLYWVAASIVPFDDGQGKPGRFVSIRTDISALKQAEAAMRTLVESTASVTGTAFFQAAVAGLAKAVGVRIGFVCAHAGPDRPVTLAWWDGDRIVENHGDTIRPSPCELLLDSGDAVLENGLSVYPDRVAERFPECPWLGDLGIESYVAIPLRDSRGRSLGHMGIMNDKPLADGDAAVALLKLFAVRVGTEMERADTERAAATLRERLRRGQIFANIGTWEWDIRTGELFWTERIAPLFGYPQGNLETSYDNFLDAVHPDDRRAVIEAVDACIRQDAPYDIEHRVVWPDGSVRWLHERGAVTRGSDGEPLKMVGVVQDIDVRKRAELALAERERQLREAQSLARLGNWWADLESGELVWSEEIFRIFGRDPERFAPSVEAFHAAVHPDDRARVRASETAAAGTGIHDVVHRILRPDGGIRHVHELARAERNAEGRIVRLHGTVQDVTEQVEAEQALIAAREAADRANQAKSDFLSSMSHELRTPMNAIIGFGQILEFDDGLDAEQQDNVQEILKAGHHLLDLINEVLDLAKIESGRIDLSLEPVDVAVLFEESRQLIAPLAARRGIELDIDPVSGAAVRADRVRLKQVLLNLLANAVKYNRERGRIRLGATEVGNRLRIAVADTGPGIAAERLAEVFQPFNRLDAEHGQVEGTGIGLAISQRLVHLMGGEIEVESEPGVGTTFSVELPRETALRPNPSGAPAGGAEAPRVGEREYAILCIDDNPANLKLVAQILGLRRHLRLTTAHAPALGIELALAHRPDLILLDINMPGMDGYQVLEVFKAEPRLKHTPVVAITANAMPRDIERGMAAGFAAYLTKPLDIERFLKTLDTVLTEAGA